MTPTNKEIATMIYAKYDMVFINEDNKKSASLAFCDIAIKFMPILDWEGVKKEIRETTYKRPHAGGFKKKVIEPSFDDIDVIVDTPADAKEILNQEEE